MRYIAPILLFILLIGCPKPDEKLDPAICDDGYHPCGADSQECCLDTTSSLFTWVMDSLGHYGSELFDAAIISPDDIWVVGEIYVWELDTVTGITEEEKYNSAHWDGVAWSLFDVPDYGTLRGVFAFDHNNVWFVTGCSVVHYDGLEFEELWFCDYEQFGFNQTATVWGTSSTNMYFAGHRGVIVHYDGNTFTRIDTGIDTDFRDITGTPDGGHIFMIGNPWYRLAEEVVIHSSGDPLTWERISYPPDPQNEIGLLDVFSADVYEDSLYIPSHYGLWKYNFRTNESVFDTRIKQTPTTIYRMTVVETPNDILLGGIKMDYTHFNGVSPHYVNEIQYNYSSVVMKGGDRKDDVVVMVGYYGSYTQALVARGYRN